MKDYEITEKIDPHKGAGIEFEHNGKQCITLHRTEMDVGVRITTYAGIVGYASHFYASFEVPSLSCVVIDSDGKEKFWTNIQPHESDSYVIEITKQADKPIYSENFGKRITEVKRGERTRRFDSVYEVIEAIESSFNKIFGEPWKLYMCYTDTTWEEYKKELLEDYGSKTGKVRM